MLRRLGYACLCPSLPDSSPKGTILRNATPARLRELIEVNLDRFGRVLRYNVEHGIRLFRISSDIIPFGSHPINEVRWWDEYRDRLADLGAYIRAHDLRVSTHPGQFTVLSTADPKILAAAVRDLEYQARLLDALGTDTRHKLVIHVGGAYGDKPAAIRRWVAAARGLPEDVRHRLVLENDERLFGVDDVLEAATAADVPVVFDVLHHRVYAGGDADLPAVLRRVFATWRPDRDGPPKLHYSTQAIGQRAGAHAEHVDPTEFRRFLDIAPQEIAFDCMLEAKAKDGALFRLRDALGWIEADGPVDVDGQGWTEGSLKVDSSAMADAPPGATTGPERQPA